MKFSYQAHNRNGELFTGEIVADSQLEAAMAVRQKGLWVTVIKEIPDKKITNDSAVKNKFDISKSLARIVKKEPRREEIVMFFRELAVLIGAGIPVHKALEILQGEKKDTAYQQLIARLLTQVLNGKSLSQAMEIENIFAASTISLIKSGEDSGTLDKILTSIADFSESSFSTHENIKSALLYPCILLIATIAAFIVMVIFVLPTFVIMLKNLDAQLPLATRVLLEIADIITVYPLPLLGLFIFSSVIIIILLSAARTRYYIDRGLLYIPLYGSLINNSIWRTILEALEVLIANGIPLQNALGLVEQSVNNIYISERIAKIKMAVVGGKTLTASLLLCREFPSALRELILAGEEAGTLELMLSRAAYFCTVHVENQSKRLEALAQPIAIFIVGGLIFFFVMAVMMPILSFMDVLT